MRHAPTVLAFVFATFVAFSPPIVSASPEAERAALARLADELAALEAVVARAERAGDAAGGRFRFDYPTLRVDLRAVQLGVQQFLSQPRREPRAAPALAGDYRR